MSENITHLAIYEDCCCILNKATRMNALFKECLNSYHDLGRLGSGTRGADRNTLHLLSRYRELNKEGKLTSHEKANIAFIMGWLTHRAADREFKLVFRESDPDSYKNKISPSDCSCYDYVYCFNVVMQGGKKEPYKPGLLDPALAPQIMDSANSLTFEKAIGAAWQQSFMNLHNNQFISDDLDKYAETAIDRFTEHYVDLKRYHHASVNPDPDKWKRFIDDINFYDAKDPIISMINSLDTTSVIEENEYKIVLSDNRSHYARSVVRGIRYIEAANDFFFFKSSVEETSSLLDIGKPELIKL